MPGTTRAGSYRDVLLLPHALRTFVPALFGRLSYGLLPLSALFTIQQSTNSFATAGAETMLISASIGRITPASAAAVSGLAFSPATSPS